MKVVISGLSKHPELEELAKTEVQKFAEQNPGVAQQRITIDLNGYKHTGRFSRQHDAATLHFVSDQVDQSKKQAQSKLPDLKWTREKLREEAEKLGYSYKSGWFTTPKGEKIQGYNALLASNSKFARVKLVE